MLSGRSFDNLKSKRQLVDMKQIFGIKILWQTLFWRTWEWPKTMYAIFARPKTNQTKNFYFVPVRDVVERETF